MLLWLGFGQMTLSQYYLKLRNDSISLENDSVILTVDEYRGDIWWESSSDLVNWVPLFRQGDSLDVRIDSSAYYRALIFEGTCDPVISDTVYLIEKLTVTDGPEFIVDTEGGVFLLPSGIKVKIPHGAVTEPKLVRVDFLGFDEANALAPTGYSARTTFLSGFSIATDEFDFHKSVKIKIPVGEVPVTSLPVLSELNEETVSWLFSDEQMIVIPADNYIEIILRESGLKSTTLKAGPKFSLNSVRNFLLKLHGAIFLREDTCRRLGFKPIINDADYQRLTNDEGGEEVCQIIRFQLEIEYFRCRPVQTGSYVGLNIEGECPPELTITPAEDLIVKKNDSQNVSLNTRIFVQPLSQQVISASSTDNILIYKPPDLTDALGDTSFDFYAVDNTGFGEIFLTVNYLYYRTTVYATSDSHMEYFEDDEVNIEYKTSIKVFTYDECTDGSLMDCSQLDNDNCEAIRETLIARAEITPEKEAVPEGESFHINVEAFNYKDEPLSPIPNIEWSSSDEAVATVVGGMVTGIAKGSATITALLCEFELECHVEVKDPCESAIVEIDISDVVIKKGESHKIPIRFMETPGGYTFIPVLEFSSRNPSVATVEDGVITGIEVGETKIDISWCDTSVVINVTVDFSDPPEPGDYGIIRIIKLMSTEVTLAFTRATDDNTEQEYLQYRVYVSGYPDINTVEDALLNGHMLLDWYYNMQEAFRVTGLQENVTYYFNIVVRDEDGNIAAYQMIRVKATEDKWCEIRPGRRIPIVADDQIQLECLVHDGDSVYSCENPEWRITYAYPDYGILYISSNGILTGLHPGYAQIEVSCEDAGSDKAEVLIRKTFGGTYSKIRVIDHEQWKQCGCYDDVNAPFHWDWYKYTYNGSLHWEITLSGNLNGAVYANVLGAEEWLGEIDSPVCENDWNKRLWEAWPPLTTVSTYFPEVLSNGHILGGEYFSIYVHTAMDEYEGDHVEVFLEFRGVYNGREFHIELFNYTPHYCLFRLDWDHLDE